MANAFFVNRREIEFVLFEHLKIQELAATPKFEAFGQDDYGMMVDEVIRFCTDVVAPLNVDADRIGATFADGEVTTPPGFKEAYSATAEAGWISASQSPEFGGMGLPGVMGVLIQEMFLGACTSFQLNMGLNVGAAHLIETFGTEAQKATYVERMFAGEWGGTMVLTEPGAGSDLGRMRTTATPQDDGTYLIEGNKCFITAGEHDLTSNIIHMVLAIMPGGKPGTRSLGLFIVPKFLVNDDGTLGPRNDMRCTGIEHKMGIHGSPTCSLAFGDEGACKGFLLGTEPYQGMRQMFQLMNEARIMTGMQGIALSNAAYENAVRYARDRVQGSDISKARKAGGGSVPLIHHADVRRMLLLQKSHVEGMRSLAYFAAYTADLAETATEEASKKAHENRLALLTPIVKAFSTDRGFLMCSEAIQVFGGYGFCGEYPVEQFARDARIAPLYEGTNFIQAADLIGRKLPLDGGSAFQALLAEIATFVEDNKDIEALSTVTDGLTKAHQATLAAVGKLMESMGAGDAEFPMSVATRFLHILGDLFVAWQLGIHARIAHDALQAGAKGDEAVFYQGKIVTARFYAANVLPGVRMRSAIIRSEDHSAMDMAAEAF